MLSILTVLSTAVVVAGAAWLGSGDAGRVSVTPVVQVPEASTRFVIARQVSLGDATFRSQAEGEFSAAGGWARLSYWPGTAEAEATCDAYLADDGFAFRARSGRPITADWVLGSPHGGAFGTLDVRSADVAIRELFAKHPPSRQPVAPGDGDGVVRYHAVLPAGEFLMTLPAAEQSGLRAPVGRSGVEHAELEVKLDADGTLLGYATTLRGSQREPWEFPEIVWTTTVEFLGEDQTSQPHALEAPRPASGVRETFVPCLEQQPETPVKPASDRSPLESAGDGVARTSVSAVLPHIVRDDGTLRLPPAGSLPGTTRVVEGEASWHFNDVSVTLDGDDNAWLAALSSSGRCYAMWWSGSVGSQYASRVGVPCHGLAFDARDYRPAPGWYVFDDREPGRR